MKVVYENSLDVERKVAARFERGALVVDSGGIVGIVAEGGVFFPDSQVYISFGALGDKMFVRCAVKKITLLF